MVTSLALGASNPGLEDSPVVAYLEKVLAQAVKLRASDLHFEPFDIQYQVHSGY